jgi:hypothetical protein
MPSGSSAEWQEAEPRSAAVVPPPVTEASPILVATPEPSAEATLEPMPGWYPEHPDFDILSGAVGVRHPPAPSPTPDPGPEDASDDITRSTPAPESPKATLAPSPEPVGPAPVVPPGSVAIGQLLVSTSHLMSRPTSGPAWDALVTHANAFTAVNLSNQDDPNNVRLLGKALVTVRTGGDVSPIHAALARVPGTEAGGRTLALGRNLAAVVLAADLTGYRDPAFVSWLREVRHARLDGMTLVETHVERANNWGTHAGASRIAVALYLGDTHDLARAASVFRGWLGERAAYAGFRYGDLDWQADPAAPVGINPRGATKQGHDVDGVLPEEQRRAGGFSWPPPQEDYVWEGLQGALLQAELLHRAGYPAYSWADHALGRAYRWLHQVAAYPAAGDDTWQPHLVNARYGTSYPAPIPARHGKNFGFTDWLYR